MPRVWTNDTGDQEVERPCSEGQGAGFGERMSVVTHPRLLTCVYHGQQALNDIVGHPNQLAISGHHIHLVEGRRGLEGETSGLKSCL